MDGCNCKEQLCISCHNQLQAKELQLQANKLQLHANSELIVQLQLENATLKEELCQANAYFYDQHKVLCNKNMDQVLKIILGNLDGVDLCRASKVCKLWNGLAQAGLASMKKLVTGRGVSKHCKQLRGPDGTKFQGCCMAISKRHIFTESNTDSDFNVYVFCTETGNYLHQLLAPPGCRRERYADLFLTKNDTVAIMKFSPVVRMWSTDTGHELHTLQLPNTVGSMAVHDFRLACTFDVDDDWSVVVFNIDSGHSVRVKLNVGDEVQICEFDVGVRHVVAVDQDPVMIKLWDIDTGLCRFTWPATSSDAIITLLVDDETQTVVDVSREGLTIWDTETGLVKLRLSMTVQWSPYTHLKKSTKLYIHHLESEFQHITVVDLRNGEVLDTEVGDSTVKGRENPFAGCFPPPILLPNDLLVSFGGKSGDYDYIDLWDVKKMTYVRQICESKLHIEQLGISNNQLLYVGCGDDGHGTLSLKLVRYKFD